LSILDDLNQSLDNQDKLDDEVLEIMKKLDLLVPKLEERKKERDAKRNLINAAPSDFIVEFAPNLLQIEKADEEKLRENIPGLVDSAKFASVAINSTSGTTSTYISGAYSYAGAVNASETWLVNVIEPFDYLADYKLQRMKIPTEVNKLFQGLGDKFLAALRSVDRAKVELANHSDGIMAMRNFIPNFWGELLAHAKQTKPLLWRRFQKGSLHQSDSRDLVAKSLGNNPNDERKLVQLLQNMSELSKEMSSLQLAKNLGLNNPLLLNTLFTRWFLLVDDVVKILQL
jgi:hypothetical protein